MAEEEHHSRARASQSAVAYLTENLLENIRVKLSSGRIAELRPISAQEQMTADVYTGGNPVLIGYYRIATALVSLDGVAPLPVTSDLNLKARVNLFSGTEIDELGNFYAVAFAPKGELLKNESSPTFSDSFAEPLPTA